MAQSHWVDIFLLLLTMASVCCQNLAKNEKSPSPFMTSNSTRPSVTADKLSVFNVAQQVMDKNSTKNATNATKEILEKFITKWKKLSVHGYLRKIPILPDDEAQEKQYTKISMQNSSGGCHLHTLPTHKNKTLHETVLDLVNSGKRLITFTIQFPEYEINPLEVNMSNNYRPYLWYRTYDTHAYTLLALPFNYKTISMGTLWFGTAELDAEVIDFPKGCFPKLSTEDKLYVTMDLVSKDFKEDHKIIDKMYGQDPHVCHQIIKVQDGKGHFSHRCCRRREEDLQLECSLYEDSTWLNGLFVVLVIVDILAFLFGPQFVNHMILSEELNVKPYEVQLDPPIDGTLCLEKISETYENNGTGASTELEPITVPNGKESDILITKLILTVDHRKLMSSEYVPVGFFKFIYDNVFRCGMRRSEPCKSCLQSTICWGCGMKTNFNNQYAKALAGIVFTPKWKDLMKSLGKLIMLICLPIPLYFRLAVYYIYESDEINARQRAIENLGVTMTKQYDLFYQLTPVHPFYQVVYGIILCSVCCLLILRQINITEFDDIILETFKDLRSVKRFETFRLFCTHFLLPFETCGICGIFFAPFYWIGMILVSIIIIVIYTIPTVYLTLRFLIPHRPSFIKKLQCKNCQFCWCPRSKMIATLGRLIYEDGVVISDDEKKIARIPEIINAEQRLFLHRISPDDTKQSYNNIHDIRDMKAAENEEEDTTHKVFMPDINHRTTVKAPDITTVLFRIAVGFFCVMFMLCSLLLFSEVVGFFVEVAIFTFMGVIVNASSAGKFITVALMLILYCVSISRDFYSSYAKLNQRIFELFTDKLDDNISAVTDKPASQQHNMAYRYLNDEEITKLSGHMSVTSTFKRDEDRDCLAWKCKGLVLFVDAEDTPRIPTKFFHRACEITVAGCPGKVVINLLRAIRKVVFMVLFLGFVLWVVILFHNVYTLTTTQQLLFTLSGSFLPFLIRFLMQMKSSQHSEFNKYAFKGSINEILISKYVQKWPICGFEYKWYSKDSPSRDRMSKASYQAGDIVSTCDRGIQTVSEAEEELPSRQRIKLNQPKLQENGNLAKLKCHIKISSKTKRCRMPFSHGKQRKKTKNHCTMDLNIDQQDRKIISKMDMVGTNEIV